MGTEVPTLLSPYLWDCLIPAGASSELWDVQAGLAGEQLCHLSWVLPGQREQFAGQGPPGVSPEGQPHPTTAQVQELGTARQP